MTTDTTKRACVFAHYDADGELADYVLYYITQLQTVADELVVVSTAGLKEEAVTTLRSMNLTLVERENVGYDFFSYKHGIEAFKSLDDYDELLLCNDSVYGPFQPLECVMRKAGEIEADLLGLTISSEIAPHLQSFFLVFRRPLLQGAEFAQFWVELRPLALKRAIVREQEIGLSSFFRSRGFRLAAIYDSSAGNNGRRFIAAWRHYLGVVLRKWNLPRFWVDAISSLSGRRRIGVNPTHVDWLYLMEELDFPFLKVELLRDNPQELSNLDAWPMQVTRMGTYSKSMIYEHLDRVKRARS